MIAKSLGHHRNTVQTWLSKYREEGLEGMLERKKSKGRVRVIPEWAEKALEKRLKEEENGFKSYGEVLRMVSREIGSRSGVSHSVSNDALSSQGKIESSKTGA